MPRAGYPLLSLYLCYNPRLLDSDGMAGKQWSGTLVVDWRGAINLHASGVGRWSIGGDGEVIRRLSPSRVGC